MSHPYRVYPDASYLYFITSTIMEWIPVFLSHRYFNIMLDAFSFARQHKGLLLHAYVVMPNHFHAMASAKPGKYLSDIMRDLKRYTSQRITDQLQEDNSRYLLKLLHQQRYYGKGNTEFKVWQDGYHPIAIYSERFLRQKMDYLHDNPVRKGFVKRPEDWLYSSAWDYVTGERGLIEIDRLVLV